MAEKNNAICSICGKSYHMCSSCKESMKLNPWKLHTCNSEHYKIYQIIHGLSTKVYDKTEAKTRLQNVDLSDLDTFRDNIKAIINDVMAVENIEEDKSVEIHEELVEESEVSLETPIFNKYKNNRKNYK